MLIARRVHSAPIAALAAFLVLARAASANVEDERAKLVEGVKKLAPTGVPGNVVLYGPSALALITGKVGDRRSAVVAASELGGGRVVAFGHNGYWSAPALGEADGWKLFENCARWAAKSGRGKVRVATWKNAEFAGAIRAHGFDAESIDALARFEKAPKPDVFCFAAWALTDDEANDIARFARSGGGLLVADTGWGWVQLNPGKTLGRDHAVNRLLAPAGLGFGHDTPGATIDGGYDASESVSRYLNAAHGLDAFAAKSPPAAWNEREAAQAAWSVAAALRVAPEDDKLFRSRLAKLRASRDVIAPTPARPLKREHALERLLLALEIDEIESLSADKMRAHPAAVDFPGAVPKDASRTVRVVALDGGVPGWLSTGLYAAPGDAIEITLPKEKRATGWHVQIGAHTDDLTHTDEAWRRVPRLVFSWPISADVVRVASPFGGLVYLQAPEKEPHGKVEVRFRGVVDAPRFVLGSTDSAEWRAKIRTFPAPWAELETRKIVLTLPASAVRAIDDPTAILTTWDRVLDSCAELAGIEKQRARPERFVCDEQIGGGYMHSGYPIMAHLDAAAFVTDVARLEKDGWGPFHELGHNHQHESWTFEGAGEVTCNLFTLFVFEEVFEKKPNDDERFTDDACARRWRAHAGEGAPFDEWKRDPFLALLMYVDVQRAFGWEAVRKAIGSYSGLEDWEKPKDDEQKRDRWLIQLSRATGKNLGPFFAAWGVPTSDQARANVGELPPWKPEWMNAK